MATRMVSADFCASAGVARMPASAVAAAKDAMWLVMKPLLFCRLLCGPADVLEQAAAIVSAVDAGFDVVAEHQHVPIVVLFVGARPVRRLASLAHLFHGAQQRAAHGGDGD